MLDDFLTDEQVEDEPIYGPDGGWGHDLGLPLDECIDGPEGCEGEVEPRWPGYGERCWMRCEKHGAERLAREEAADNPDSPCAPAGFDPLDAGERWDLDY